MPHHARHISESTPPKYTEISAVRVAVSKRAVPPTRVRFKIATSIGTDCVRRSIVTVSVSNLVEHISETAHRLQKTPSSASCPYPVSSPCRDSYPCPCHNSNLDLFIHSYYMNVNERFHLLRKQPNLLLFIYYTYDLETEEQRTSRKNR